MFFSAVLCLLIPQIMVIWSKPHLREVALSSAPLRKFQGCIRRITITPRDKCVQRQISSELLGLPSNATTIREQISTSFSCESRNYGFYADPENDCQLFHVCLPVQYGDGTQETFKWSFICPQETVFNQPKNFTYTNSIEHNLINEQVEFNYMVKPAETTCDESENEIMTCMRPEDSVDCQDSPSLYSLNDRFGQTNVTSANSTLLSEDQTGQRFES